MAVVGWDTKFVVTVTVAGPTEPAASILPTLLAPFSAKTITVFPPESRVELMAIP